MNTFGKRLDGPGGRRVAARAPVLLRAALNTMTSSRPVTLFDVSANGAQISMPQPLHSGQQLWLKIDSTIIFGSVVWVKDEMCGIAFDDPLNDETLTMLQARGKVVTILGLSADEQLGAEDWESGFTR